MTRLALTFLVGVFLFVSGGTGGAWAVTFKDGKVSKDNQIEEPAQKVERKSSGSFLGQLFGKKSVQIESNLNECPSSMVYLESDFKWVVNSTPVTCFGFYQFSDGGHYNGEFKNGLLNGRGAQTWVNGSKYIGEFRNNFPHGNGTYSFSDGSEYVGEFKDNKQHGQGTLIWGSKTKWAGDKYVGEFENDIRTGQGTYIFVNGDEYVGEFKDDKLNGQGTYNYTDGGKFVGEFKDDKKHGHGTLIYTDGGKFVGEFKDDRRNGQGIITYASGAKFVGRFRDGPANGQGTMAYEDGSKYVGNWINSKRDGQGTFIWGSNTEWAGDKYVGEWKDDNRTGHGTYISYSSGIKYVGEFKDNKLNGFATSYNVDGSIDTQGIWKNGEFQYAKKPPSTNTTTLASSLPPCPTDTSLFWTNCFGALNIDGGDKYVGEFKDDNFYGQGTYIFASGEKYFGEFEANNFHGQGTYIYGPNSEWAGDKYVGEFKDDKINGQGTYLFSDGSKQIGEFTNALLNGFGTYYRADGTIINQGIWKDSEFQYAKKPQSTNSTSLASIKPTSAELTAAQREAERLREELAALKSDRQQKQQQIDSDTQVPLITITSSSSNDRRGQISGTAQDNIAIAEVRVDGRPVLLKSNGRFEWQGFIPAGGKSVVVEAIDTAGLSSIQQVRIERGQIQQARGPIFADLDPTAGKRVQANNNALALIVGIADYERTDASAIYADKDAQYFHDYASLKLGIPDSNITTMVNDKAEQGDVILAVKDWMRRSSKPGKTDVYVFFAGHGLASDDGEQMYLLPFDGRPRLLDKTAILREELFSDIASANPRSVTVFLDTCYSGTTRSTDMLIASRPIGIRALEQSIPDNFTVMTAAAGDQTAKPLEEAKHGMFSYFLMKGMEGEADANNDNQITAGELHAYVEQNVVQQSSGSQTPELQGDASRVLVRFQ